MPVNDRQDALLIIQINLTRRRSIEATGEDLHGCSSRRERDGFDVRALESIPLPERDHIHSCQRQAGGVYIR
jgi:hypothetical protein